MENPAIRNINDMSSLVEYLIEAYYMNREQAISEWSRNPESDYEELMKEIRLLKKKFGEYKEEKR